MSTRLPVTTFDHDQTLPGAFHFPTRMSVLALDSAGLALVSPVPIDEARARAIEALGEVRYLIAPNRLHGGYLAASSERYPNARVLAPRGLRERRPALRVDGTLDAALPAELTAAVEVTHIEGAPGTDEYVFLHRATKTLVTTDLVFNVVAPRGITAHLTLFVVGCHGRLAQSRAWRFLVKDRAAATRSVERVLSQPIDTLVMAHGAIVREDAHAKLADALRWLRPERRMMSVGEGT